MILARSSIGSVLMNASAAIALALSAAGIARAEIDFAPTWQPPKYAAVRDAVASWAKEAQLSGSIASQVDELWPANPGEAADGVDVLDRVAQSLALGDERAAQLVTLCRDDYAGPAVPDAAWLAESDVPEFMRHNLRLYYARWLAQYSLYDEVLDALDGLKPADVVDPASLLFYRMIAHHQLVQPDEARAALVELLEHREALPQRYQQVAQLLERDLEALDDESLDHIARRMNDIRRRLSYGRTGASVQEIERGVIESLDRRIDELQQQQQQQQSMSQSGGSPRSSPMPSSRSAGAPGSVPPEPTGSAEKSGWGELPPREREQALQQIGRDFPAHYRDVIEQYFRELATESDEASP